VFEHLWAAISALIAGERKDDGGRSPARSRPAPARAPHATRGEGSSSSIEQRAPRRAARSFRRESGMKIGPRQCVLVVIGAFGGRGVTCHCRN